MVIGIGTDILKMDGLQPAYLKHEDAFFRKAYTPKEQAEAALRERPEAYYATRFAGKEAVYKALNRDGAGFLMNQVEILNRESGRPYVTLHGEVKREAQKAGIENVLISLSYDGEYAVAYATALGRAMESMS